MTAKRISWHSALLVVLFFGAGAGAQVSISQLATLTSSDGGGTIGGGIFGSAVAMDGDTVVVGASEASGFNGPDAGAAYVFVMPAAGWTNMTQTAKLTASDGAELDSFGIAVAIRGNVIAVGADWKGLLNNHKSSGAVYVFVKPAGGWTDMTETAELTASDDNSEAGYFLGRGVAIDGDGRTVFAGAPLRGSNGAIYVFEEPAGGWSTATQNAELTSSDGVGIGLGGAVAASGNTVISGGDGWPDSEISKCCLGSVYVWTKPVGRWKGAFQNARLTSADSASGNQLGLTVGFDDGTIVAGAVGYTKGGYFPGLGYVFTEPDDGWSNTSQYTARLTSLSGGAVGAGLAIGGDTIILGAPGYKTDAGAAYLYQEPANGWQTTQQFDAAVGDPGSQPQAFFGSYLAVEANITAIGAYLQKPSGAVYVYQIMQ